MKVAFYTLGCKVNQYETQAMEQLLREEGHQAVSSRGHQAVSSRTAERIFFAGRLPSGSGATFVI